MNESKEMSTPLTEQALAARERAIENSKVDHGAIYAHVAATKPQIFGAPQFADCPQCDKPYRLFNNPLWKGDQSVCQACADKNFAFTRDKMQRIELAYAEEELQQRLADETDAKQLENGVIGPFLALSGAAT